MRKLARIAAVVLSVALLVGLLGSFFFPTVRYIVRAGWEEGKLLGHRQPINRVMADSTTPVALRKKLALVLEARAFAADSLGLRVKKSFTTYAALPHDTLVLVLSGAYRDALRPVTWWFPIVGDVPYKGFFEPAQALAAMQQLRAEGYDAHVRPSSAFSTLGFFNDPVVSTTLESDSVELVNTVIHELTHNTYYAAGRIPFNESFANFVGSRGAEQFFRSRGDSALAREAAERWEDTKILGRFWAMCYHSLDSAFRAHPDDKVARLAARDTIYARAAVALVKEFGPQLHTVPPAALAHVHLDNAIVLAHRVYATGLDDFDAIYARNGNDLRRTVVETIALAKAHKDDPFGAIHQAISP